MTRAAEHSTSQQPRRILMACYGGGHVQSLIPVARALANIPGTDLSVIGFTTARAAFERAGISTMPYTCLLQPEDDPWLDLARDLAPAPDHADITADEHFAYYAIGLCDLFGDLGEEEARRAFAQSGRKAFHPQRAFERYLKRTTPDLVVATTSPRSELALLRAAQALGTPALAVSDLFLQAEADYICQPGYAGNVAVFCTFVADFLRENGYTGRLWVTGNPAFDPLKQSLSPGLRARRRAELNLADDQRLVMWVCASADVSLTGKKFQKPAEVIAGLHDLMAQDPSISVLVRQHPNRPVLDPSDILPATESPAGWCIEDCLAACDAVLVETSTVGLQAALIGRPVVSINAGDYPPYAALGISTDLPDIASACQTLRDPSPPDLSKLDADAPGIATAAVLDVIAKLSDTNSVQDRTK